MRRSSPDHAVAFGMFLATLSVYVATSPGRIDIIDGQSRYDVAFYWLIEGRPHLWDGLIGPFMAVPGRDGLPYGYYGAAGSLFAMPLVGLGFILSGVEGETSRFFFSLTTPIFGALTAAVLYLFYRLLNVSPRAAIGWTLVTAFATLLWPGAVTSFDNAQQGFFVLAAVYLAFVSATRRSLKVAAAAGLVGGVLMLYQEYFALVIPALALATLDVTVAAGPRIRIDSPRASWLRFVTLGTASIVGLALALAYNEWRFGSWFENGKLYWATEGSVLGNPVTGLLTLFVSPGKSIFLYSPTVVLGLLGFAHLWRRHTAVGVAIAATTVVLTLFYSFFQFVGGDWCWGPRYLLVVLPLWALAFPFVPLHTRGRKRIVGALVAAGLAVQLLGISVEHQRFFFSRQLEDPFWGDPWAYFKLSALAARPAEVLSLKDGPPGTARFFSTVPLPGWTTYALLGPPRNMARSRAPEWMKQFQVYYVPRPWPLWMWRIDADLRPINMAGWLIGLLLIGTGGVAAIRVGLRERVA